MDDFLKLTWRMHLNNFKDVIKDLQKTECLSDVTLVCNDDTKIKAHKFVLIGSSSVLRTMLLESSQRETVVYLRGVDRRELEWLLEFMYLGQTQVPQTKLQSFIELAKDLKMKGIHNENDEKNAENVEGIYNEDDESNKNAKDKTAEHAEANVVEEKEIIQKIKLSALEVSEFSNQEQFFRYSCGFCSFESKNKIQGCARQHLKDHIERQHEGIRYPCDICPYQSKGKQNLKDHKASIHKIDPIFRCMLCDYCTNHTTGWKKHARHKHPNLQAHEIFTETRRSDRKLWTRQHNKNVTSS